MRHKVSPVTPHATEAQETFLSELEGLLSATAATASAPAGGAAVAPAEGGGVSSEGGGEEAAGSEAAYWREMFEQLSAMRQTVPEEQLALFKEQAAQRDRSAEELLEQLRCALRSFASL